ncbi:MAG: hypothetical protein ACQERC_00715 [Bacteroidota bacterium]
MKKVTVLLTFGLLLALSSAYAQQEKAAEKSNVKAQQEKNKAEKGEDLNLSPEQKKELKAINEKYAEKERALQNELKALRQAKREEMKSVLTPEQQKKAATARKKRIQRHKMRKQKRKQNIEQRRIEPKKD